jgi:hypothetical protein
MAESWTTTTYAVCNFCLPGEATRTSRSTAKTRRIDDGIVARIYSLLSAILLHMLNHPDDRLYALSLSKKVIG